MKTLVEKLLETTKDLSGLSLRGEDFTAMNLTNVRFSGSDLTNAVFEDADLSYAEFIGADLTGARFEYANLFGANFLNANLKEAHIEKTNFSGANVPGIIQVGPVSGHYITYLSEEDIVVAEYLLEEKCSLERFKEIFRGQAKFEAVANLFDGFKNFPV